MGVFAEFERSMIQERVKAGIKRVRTKGQRWGRPTIKETYPAICTRILEPRQEGLGMGSHRKSRWSLKSNRLALSARSISGVISDLTIRPRNKELLPPFLQGEENSCS
jgi:DNA invertase Pin-like site-specific DNA recombinase